MVIGRDKDEAFLTGRIEIDDSAQVSATITSHLIGLNPLVNGIVGIKRIMADGGRLHVLLFTGNDYGLPMDLLLGPIQ